MKKSMVAICLSLLLLSFGSLALGKSKGGLDAGLIKRLTAGQSDDATRTMADIVAARNVKDIALNRKLVNRHNDFINHELKTGEITNQKSSGRCWMFAGFNVLRPKVMQNLQLKTFEFSENYLMFWDKMEKSNMFLQNMIEMADLPLDDRELQIIIDGPLGDGGWWTYFTGLVEKYGVVPQDVMPETYNSSASGTMNRLMTLKLGQMGVELRQSIRSGNSTKDAISKKEIMLAQIFDMLVLNLGRPPVDFEWRYETEDTTITGTIEEHFTPKSFYKKALPGGLNAYVALFNYPGKEFYINYSLRQSRNIYDQPNFTILNLPIDSLKHYALMSVLDSTPVWFACDVGKGNYGKKGIFARDIYNYEKIYNLKFDLPKKDLIQMGLITPNHAMTFMGVDTVDNLPRKWLVENSWGKDKGVDGKWCMYDSWFDQYMFGVIIEKKYLSENLRKMSQKSPIELSPWDPMYRLNQLD